MSRTIKLMSISSLFAIFSLFLFALTPIVAQEPEVPEQQAPPTFTNVVNSVPEISIFSAALKDAGLEKSFSQGQNTVFAPVDSSIKSLSPEVITRLISDRQLRLQVLRNHVVKGIVTPAQLEQGVNLSTMSGNRISSSVVDDKLVVDGKPIVGGVRFDHGVIYLVDGTFLPPANPPTTE